MIGRYWVAHHQFCSRLRAVDGGLIAINLVYLAFVAFLPFPTDLLGNYFDNPISIVRLRAHARLVSGLEVALFARAHEAGLLRRPIPPEVFRWGASVAFSPVIFFLISIPVAFVDTALAVATWFVAIPAQLLFFDRRKPPGADELLG